MSHPTRTLMSAYILKRNVRFPVCKALFAMLLAAFVWGMTPPLSAQSLFQRFDSVLTENYRKANFDTAYIMRPRTKWTVRTRINVSGSIIETEGADNGRYFKSEMEAVSKATLSLGSVFSVSRSVRRLILPR